MPEEEQEQKSTIKFVATDREILNNLSRSVEALTVAINNLSEQIVLAKN